ncbi:MAG: TrmH family RNA methyltransferase [Chitinophagia bacterium]|jgi:tRNA G18 (ribose-2'-O)-methylase SpoU|nr:TrmH family RNA methyltransferase [Chitinophagia bacterium]
MLKKSMDELQRLSQKDFQEAEKHPVTILLDNVRSMHNVGSVFRTADAFRVEKILLGGYTPKPPHRDIQKTALGATETVQWEACEDAVLAIENLKNMGYRVLAVEQTHDSFLLQELQLGKGEKTALVFGNEAEGVSESCLAACDGAVEIPQFGSKHSFNISVSAGIVLWEVYKKMQA